MSNTPAPSGTPRRRRGPNAHLIVRCLCLDNGRLLLVRHRSLRTGRDFWTLPGGFVETGETLAAAGERELREETGLAGSATGLAGIFELTESDLCEVILLFGELTGTARLGSDPDLPEGVTPVLRDVRWTPLDDLPPLQPRAFFDALAMRAGGAPPTLPLPHRINAD